MNTCAIGESKRIRAPWATDYIHLYIGYLNHVTGGIALQYYNNPQFCIHGHIEEIRQNRRIIYARAYTRFKKRSKCTKSMKSNNKTERSIF